MSRQDTKVADFGTLTRRGIHDQTVAVLAIGDMDEWRQRGHVTPSESSVAFARFEDVTVELLDRLSPSCVLSPALSRRFDCIELAQLLHTYGYKGRYRAISDDLPRPELVEREVAQLCPDLNFAILVRN